jgi:hypothetical protein
MIIGILQLWALRTVVGVHNAHGACSAGRPVHHQRLALVLHRLIAAEDHDVDFLDAAEPPEDEAARHELAVALLDLAATDSEAWHVPHLSAHAGGLVRPADLQWLLQCEGRAE